MLLPGASLLALTQHWLSADKDPIWSHFQGTIGLDELWTKTHVVHFSQPGKPI